jgi:hypothetical protein
MGAALIAIGVVVFILNYGIWNQRRGGSFAEPFLVMLALTLVLWLVLRRPPRSAPKAVLLGMAATARLAMLLTMPLLLTCTLTEGFVDPMWKGARASLKSDLRDLESAQSKFRTDSGRYLATVDGLDRMPGVSHPAVTLTSDGWFASVEHRETGQRCDIFVGTPPSHLMGNEGEPSCVSTGSAPFPWTDSLIGIGTIAIGLALGGVAWTAGRSTPG